MYTCAFASSPSFCLSSDCSCSMAEAEVVWALLWWRLSMADTLPLPPPPPPPSSLISLTRDFSSISLCKAMCNYSTTLSCPVHFEAFLLVYNFCTCVCIVLAVLDCRDSPLLIELANWDLSRSWNETIYNHSAIENIHTNLLLWFKASLSALCFQPHSLIFQLSLQHFLVWIVPSGAIDNYML